MSLELRHLRTLVAVAQEGSFTAAAALLGVSQPTLSRTVSQVEELVGRRLVERTTRHVTLTPAGESLALEARAILARLDRALAAVTAEGAAALRLGWTWAAFGAQTAPLLASWRHASRAELSIVRTTEPFRDLDSGVIDAAICRTVLPEEVDLGRYDTAHLYTESLLAAVSVHGHLADRSSVTLADLARERVALGSTAPTVTPRLWEGLGIVPTTVEVETIDEWLTRITLQDVVGLTPLTSAYSYPHPEVRYLPISDAPLVEVTLAWPHAHPHAEVEGFASFARRHFRDLAEQAERRDA